MSGSLLETKYYFPEDEETTSEEVRQMKIIDETHYKVDEVTYINGKCFFW